MQVVREVAELLAHPRPAWAPKDLPDDVRKSRDATLGGGCAGVALVHAYLAAAHPGEGHERAAADLLNRAGETLAIVPMGPSLYAGFTGVAWVVEYLKELGLLSGEEDPNAEIDEALLAELSSPSWQGEYDLISGLVGMGIYALARLPRTEAAEGLSRILDRLGKMAVRLPDGVAWKTPPEHLAEHQRETCPDGCFNLGVAHGIPAVIAFLGAASAAGFPRAQPLLEGAVAWVSRQRSGRFPYWVAASSASDPARSAWCYGDPGVAAALLSAARSTRNADWERWAVDIACADADRPQEETGVVDAGLCHGAAGLAHLFNRMYQTTGERRLADAAVRWYRRTLDLRRPGKGIAGYETWDGSAWVEDPGFLSGAAGIALSLRAACTEIEPTWDRLLLISPLINDSSRTVL